MSFFRGFFIIEPFGKPFKPLLYVGLNPRRRKVMAKCSKCGVDVPKAEKSWTLAPKGKKPVPIGL